MSDIRDWGRFIRGRWEWTGFGYEKGFPRGCQFGDVDAAVEFDGRSLEIEAAHWDGLGCVPRKNGGQRYRLRREAEIPGRTALIVYGCRVTRAEGAGAGAGHIPCVICAGPIDRADWPTAQVWTDPGSNTCAAHFDCLARVGELELGLIP